MHVTERRVTGVRGAKSRAAGPGRWCESVRDVAARLVRVTIGSFVRNARVGNALSQQALTQALHKDVHKDVCQRVKKFGSRARRNIERQRSEAMDAEDAELAALEQQLLAVSRAVSAEKAIAPSVEQQPRIKTS